MSIPVQARRRASRPLLMAGLVGTLAAWGPPQAPQQAPQTSVKPEAPLADDTSETALQESQAMPEDDPFEDPPPRDPNDSRFMEPPRGQLGQWSAGRTPPTWRGFDDDHKVQLTATPTYAAIHAPFIGRGAPPNRGGGIGLELDLRLFRWLFFRVYGSHTVHPAFEETSFDEDSNELTLTANEGLIHATNTGASIVYALDLGRYVPRVDAGAGLMFVRTPMAAQDGQWGGECRSNGVCDVGLSCNGENMCRPTPVPEVHLGIGLDILFGQRFALGASVRYYALLSALDALPFYLQGSVRLSLRF